ncbi:TPA: hypothetical protein ACFNUX_002014, partial [Neisseria meningitidis]
EKTETPTASFPTDRHSRKSGNPATEKPQESISKNRNPHRPSFPQKRESKNTTQQEFIGKNRNPTAVIPAKAGIQTRRHGNLPNKTVSLDSTSQIPAFAGMTRF